MQMLERMKALAKEKDTCVLATVSGSDPHCSLMAYVTDDDCRKIYLTTHRNTLKYRNVIENPSVSLLIDTREDHKGSRRAQGKALTIKGVCRQVEGEKRERVRADLLARHPHLKDFVDHPDAAFICVEIQSFQLLEGLTRGYFEAV